jgi:bacterial/archaeal transporter family-2 protein
MNLLVLLATIGAGVGLAGGLAFNLRLAKALKTPLAATLVNFLVGASVLLLLWLVGLDGARPSALPPLWMLIGGLLGSTYVTLSLIGAARLGVGVSTVAVTLGQVLGAAVITGLGWLGQTPQRPTLTTVFSALLLIGAVALLARDRERAKE